MQKRNLDVGKERALLGRKEGRNGGNLGKKNLRRRRERQNFGTSHRLQKENPQNLEKRTKHPYTTVLQLLREKGGAREEETPSPEKKKPATSKCVRRGKKEKFLGVEKAGPSKKSGEEIKKKERKGEPNPLTRRSKATFNQLKKAAYREASNRTRDIRKDKFQDIVGKKKGWTLKKKRERAKNEGVSIPCTASEVSQTEKCFKKRGVST